MKNLALHIISAASLLLSFQFGFCQTVGASSCCYEGKNYTAFIDNQSLALNGYRPVNAVLVDEPSLGDAARTVVDITINGREDRKEGEKPLDETVKLRLALVEPISPESAICSVTLDHKGTTYTMVKGDASNVEVTDFVWSMDRKSFILSVQYNCTMHSLGSANDGASDLHLKGKLLRVHVTNAGAVSASED